MFLFRYTTTDKKIFCSDIAPTLYLLFVLATIIFITNSTIHTIFIASLSLCLAHPSCLWNCIENNFSGIFKFQRIRRRRDEIFIVSPAPRDRMRCAKFLGEIATFSFSPCQLLPWIVLTISHSFQLLYWNVNSIGIIFGPRLPRTIWQPPPSLIRKPCYIIVEPSSYLQNDAACIDSVR